MTFKFPVKNGFNFKTFPAIIEEKNKEYQLGIAEVLHFAKQEKAKVYINQKLVVEKEINFGVSPSRSHPDGIE